MKKTLKQPNVDFLSLIPLQAHFHSDIVKDEFVAEVFEKGTGTETNIVFGSIKSEIGQCSVVVS